MSQSHVKKKMGITFYSSMPSGVKNKKATFSNMLLNVLA